jgi:hypothetical protein
MKWTWQLGNVELATWECGHGNWTACTLHMLRIESLSPQLVNFSWTFHVVDCTWKPKPCLNFPSFKWYDWNVCGFVIHKRQF